MSEEKSGVALIAEERQRQIDKEGYTPSHDDDHDDEELVKAASCYLIPLSNRWVPPARWPWRYEDWKPMQGASTEGRVRELVKAGALIAAEIDRLQRVACGCKETYPQLQPGQINHGPGCPRGSSLAERP